MTPCAQRSDLYMFFVVFAVVMLFVLLVLEVLAVIQAARKQAEIRALRVRGSGLFPELMLDDGKRFHVLLSRELLLFRKPRLAQMRPASSLHVKCHVISPPWRPSWQTYGRPARTRPPR